MIFKHIDKLQKLLYTPIHLKLLTNTDTIKSMDRVDFIEQNEFHIKSRRILGDLETPTMIRILLKVGIVKTEKQALFVLLGVSALVLFFTIFLINARINPATSNIVVDTQGNTYTFEQYIELVRQGRDPLLPQ